MDRTELYLKTAFCCMACDGDIAQQELETIKRLQLFGAAEYLPLLDKYVEQLRADGVKFLRAFLNELKSADLTEREECQLTSVAVQVIEADNDIQYNEIAFFKKIRSRLKATDELLLTAIPVNPAVVDQISPEDYLLPDIIEDDDFSMWDNNLSNINIQQQ